MCCNHLENKSTVLLNSSDMQVASLMSVQTVAQESVATAAVLLIVAAEQHTAQ